MPDVTNSIMTGIHMVDGVLVVQAPNTFDDDSLTALRACVLEKAHALGARGVVLDVSSLRVLDSVSFGLLADTARTLTFLGARTIFSGFQPGVVVALIEFNVDSQDIHVVPDVADGLALLRPEPEPEDEADEPPEDLEEHPDELAAEDDEDEPMEQDEEEEDDVEAIDPDTDEADAADDDDEQ
ncbi:STAS domain-containing protein [Desulfocurvus sp. DL9XJH121]